jgi:hypothetical protein
MVSFEVVSDIWILALTALTGYLIITRQKGPRVMTPAEYDEWLLHNDDERDETVYQNQSNPDQPHTD